MGSVLAQPDPNLYARMGEGGGDGRASLLIDHPLARIEEACIRFEGFRYR